MPFDFSSALCGSDLILRVDGGVLHAHKQMMSLWSSVFIRMINQADLLDRNHLALHGRSFNQINTMLKLMYDKTANVTDDSVEFLLVLATDYEMEMLREICIEHIRKSDDILKHWNLILQFNINGLQKECVQALHRMKNNKLKILRSVQRNHSADLGYLKLFYKLMIK